MNVNLTGIRACVFDAYGTLFDVNSAAERTQDALREKWQQLAEVWRAKQLQYTWLRSLTGRHIDFWQLTSEALDFALDTLNLPNGQLHDHRRTEPDAVSITSNLRRAWQRGRRGAALSTLLAVHPQPLRFRSTSSHAESGIPANPSQPGF
jgi:hypothetical protein